MLMLQQQFEAHWCLFLARAEAAAALAVEALWWPLTHLHTAAVEVPAKLSMD